MLDEGCIELMHSGQTAGQAGANPYRVQIIDIKPIKNPQGGAADRHRLVISDGRHYMQARHPAGAARGGARRRPATPSLIRTARAPHRLRGHRKPRARQRCRRADQPRLALRRRCSPPR